MQKDRTDRPSAGLGLAHICGALPRIAWLLFGVYIVLCLCLNVFVAPFLDYRTKNALSAYGFLFLVLGFALGALCCVLVKKLPAPRVRSPFLKAHGFGACIAAGTMLLLAAQAFVIHGCSFTGNAADWNLLMRFDSPLELSAYLSIYPNNQLLCGLFAIIFKAAALFGCDPLPLCIFGGCLSISGSVCLAAFIARALGGDACGVCAFLLLAAFAGLSPELLVPYTDAYGMIFPTLTIFLFVCLRTPFKWPLMVLTACMGYHMKPTAVAAFAAVAFVQGCFWLKAHLGAASTSRGSSQTSPQQKSARAGRAALIVLLCAAALFAGNALASAMKQQTGVITYPDEAVVPAHYLMMGFNDEHDGMYNTDDTGGQSWKYHTRASMTEADLAVWRERVHALGAPGVLHLMVKKNLINYGRGDLNFDRSTPNAIQHVLGNDRALQAFYGISDPVPADAASEVPLPPTPWQCVAQVLWFMILAGIALCLFRRKPTGAEAAMALALLLLSGFLLLFECNARYLYLYAPFYVILAVRGWQAFGHQAARWLREGHGLHLPKVAGALPRTSSSTGFQLRAS